MIHGMSGVVETDEDEDDDAEDGGEIEDDEGDEVAVVKADVAVAVVTEGLAGIVSLRTFFFWSII